MTAPQPSRKARVMTLRFVPGGPDPITNGFGSFNPSTVVASVGILDSLAKPGILSVTGIVGQAHRLPFLVGTPASGRLRSIAPTTWQSNGWLYPRAYRKRSLP